MKSLFLAAALVAVAAAPALAAPADEVAMERGLPVRVVEAPAYETGAGEIVNGEIDGTIAPASVEGLRFTSRPGASQLNHGGGR